MENPLDFAYLAGLVDGDGHVFARQGRTGGLRVDVLDEAPMRWLAERFGGKVYTFRKPSGRAMFRWQIESRATLLLVLPDLIPHLRIKRAEAEALQVYAEVGDCPVHHKTDPAGHAVWRADREAALDEIKNARRKRYSGYM